MEDLILVIAKSLVYKPDAVDVTQLKGDKTMILELKVAKEDFGEVIGKRGKTAHAIRTILKATATKLKQRAVLEILE